MAFELTKMDKKIIREIQNGLPPVKEPYLAVSKKIGIDEEELITRLKKLKEEGIIRRFGARVVHHKSGYKENIMTVWNVPSDKVEETGNFMASYPQISHCYVRSLLPDMPYNLYSMIHGREEGECLRVIKDISEKTGITDYVMLPTKREYKKTAPVYFLS